MSHFTEIKSSIRDLDVLLEALKTLGHDVSYDGSLQKVRGYMGDTLDADVRINLDGKYDVGLKKDTEGDYIFVADWEMLSYQGVQKDAFCNKIKQGYSLSKASQSFVEQGYSISSVEKDENGNLNFTVYR